jgi:hypothetical protein
MKRCVMLMGLIGLAVMVQWPSPHAHAQTATPDPNGPRVEAFEDVNVRAGPNTVFDPPIGRLVPGQTALILGKYPTAQYLWLKIVYFGGPNNEGWVVRELVRTVGDLEAVPVVAEIPPTPTVPPTPTIPFGEITITPFAGENRLPTFTPPVIVPQPTLLPAQGVLPNGGTFPPALAILVLFVLGVFAGGISLLRGRG